MTTNIIPHTISVGAPHIQLRERVAVVVIVVILHFAVLAAWLIRPPAVLVSTGEMEVAFAFAPDAARAEKKLQQPLVKITPIQPPDNETTEPTLVYGPLPNEPAVQQSEALAAVAAKPVAYPIEAAPQDIEPDYKAFYLNNHVTYPLAARRMGIQGRVVLNVEVLAAGISGGINIHVSSGNKVLDRAALESVRNWRFVPASRAGQPFTKWFRIPIQFSLKDNEA